MRTIHTIALSAVTAVFLGGGALLPARATITTNVANADVWVADDTPDANFEGSVNPSTQLRNDGSVRRVSFYQFTVPAVGLGFEVQAATFDINDFFGPSDFIADFGLLAGNPDLSAITYNTAISDGFLQAGNDSSQNPVIGANMTLAGDLWDQSGAANGDDILFSGTGGFVALLNTALQNTLSATTITLALVPQDPVASATGAGFYGLENGEGGGFFPHPRLILTTGAIPEPGTFVMLGLGGLVVYVLRRRR